MKILVTNDDGINSIGLRNLVEKLTKYGELIVVAPKYQCSAMSMRISLRKEMKLEKIDFGLLGVDAFSLTGTPVDCVKVALNYILDSKPDYIFSGLNAGYNTGFDTLYSATVGAAMEGVIHNIPSAAFSINDNNEFGVFNTYSDEIINEVIENPLDKEIYNVNFPGCNINDFKGIQRGTKLSREQIFIDKYFKSEGIKIDTLDSDVLNNNPRNEKGISLESEYFSENIISKKIASNKNTLNKRASFKMSEDNSKREEDLMVEFIEERGVRNSEEIFIEGTDNYAVYNNYISISKIRCNVL